MLVRNDVGRIHGLESGKLDPGERCPAQGDRPAPTEGMNRDACVFTRRGDVLATGWLAAYNKIGRR